MSIDFKRDGHHFYFDISCGEFLCINCLRTDDTKKPCDKQPKPEKRTERGT